MRHGVPVAGNFLQQELAVMTGAVEMMLVDVQCVMPSLSFVAGCFHTKVVSTSPLAHTQGFEAFSFDEENALEQARTLVRSAIDNFPNRAKNKVIIPDERVDFVAGFSVRAIHEMFGGTFRSTFRPLNDAIIDGRIRGVAGVVGCNNPKKNLDGTIVPLVKELIKNDVLVLLTGLRRHHLREGRASDPGNGRAGLRAPGLPKCARRSACRRCCTWDRAWTTAAS